MKEKLTLHEDVLSKVEYGVVTEVEQLTILYHPSSLASQLTDELKDADQTVTLLDLLDSGVDRAEGTSATYAIAARGIPNNAIKSRRDRFSALMTYLQ